MKVSKRGYKSNTYTLKWTVQNQDLVSTKSIDLVRKEPKRKPRRKLARSKKSKRTKRKSRSRRPKGKGILMIKSRPIVRIYIDNTFIREARVHKEEVSAGFHTVKICLSRIPTNCRSKTISVPANDKAKVIF